MNIKKNLQIEYLIHMPEFSDHIGIRVTIENENGVINTYQKREIINKA